MFKWILLIFGIYLGIGIFIAYTSSYTPISKQIDVKTMSFTQPSFVYRTFSNCVGTCRDYSSDSSSSSWGGGGGGK